MRTGTVQLKLESGTMRLNYFGELSLNMEKVVIEQIREWYNEAIQRPLNERQHDTSITLIVY